MSGKNLDSGIVFILTMALFVILTSAFIAGLVALYYAKTTSDKFSSVFHQENLNILPLFVSLRDSIQLALAATILIFFGSYASAIIFYNAYKPGIGVCDLNMSAGQACRRGMDLQERLGNDVYGSPLLWNYAVPFLKELLTGLGIGFLIALMLLIVLRLLLFGLRLAESPMRRIFSWAFSGIYLSTLSLIFLYPRIEDAISRHLENCRDANGDLCQTSHHLNFAQDYIQSKLIPIVFEPWSRVDQVWSLSIGNQFALSSLLPAILAGMCLLRMFGFLAPR